MKKPRKPRWWLQHGVLKFTGNTKREADAARDAYLDEVGAVDPEPYILSENGPTLIVVSYDHVGRAWHRTFYYPGVATRSGLREGGCTIEMGCTREQAIRHAHRHAAQRAIPPAEELTRETALETLHWILPRDREGHEEHVRYLAMQLVIRDAPELWERAQHIGDHAARQELCDAQAKELAALRALLAQVVAT